ncbi:DUF5916 domain-containing protein [Aliikangiella sp. IMCC44359]|uniref:DUF5916 domain-containing protein n=1 Tax=Aliikangiella sp. IMCC44359 TaxID=3459125 RepID=UPI00403ADCC1
MIKLQTAINLKAIFRTFSTGFLLCVISFQVCAFNSIGSVPYISKSAINLDGEFDEAEWSQALEIYLNFETSPGENIPSPVGTRALIFEDGSNLYIAFEANDIKPELTRAYLSDRDNISASDLVGIKLDTFNDSRKAFQFKVNPLGIQADSIIDEQKGTSDESWDAIWYSVGKLTSQGFNVELQIPYSALRFEDGEKIKTWGLEVFREWRRDVTHNLSNQIIDRNIGCELCQMGKVDGFSKVNAPSNFTLIPSLTVIKTDSRSLNANSDWVSGEVEDRASIDFRWGLAQNTYLNATINPDFSQVEADSLELEINSLSSLYLKEKRPFFLDGADYFSNWSRLVYTRVFEEPEYGVKLTGKEGEHSYGLISLQDKHTQLLVPDEYGTQLVRLEDKASRNHIFRYRYDLGDTGNIGTTLTSREAEDYRNQMLGIDGKLWLSESDYFKFQALTSESLYPEEIVNNVSLAQEKGISGNAISLNYTHTSRNWDWFTTYHYFDSDFRADTGYIGYSNWKRAAIGGSRTWFSDEQGSWWKSLNILVDWADSKEINGAKLDDGGSIYITLKATYESILGFELIDVKEYYLGHAFDTQKQTFSAELNPLSNLAMSFTLVLSDEIDYELIELGDSQLIKSSFDYQVTRQLNTEFEYIYKAFQIDNMDIYDTDIINLSTSYQIDERSFIRLSAQGQSTDFIIDEQRDRKVLASQLIYSYKVNPFTLFYLGYSDGYISNIDHPNLKKTDKTLFMKFSYAWQL